jgi:hypothetical protein
MLIDFFLSLLKMIDNKLIPKLQHMFQGDDFAIIVVADHKYTFVGVDLDRIRSMSKMAKFIAGELFTGCKFVNNEIHFDDPNHVYRNYNAYLKTHVFEV